MRDLGATVLLYICRRNDIVRVTTTVVTHVFQRFPLLFFSAFALCNQKSAVPLCTALSAEAEGVMVTAVETKALAEEVFDGLLRHL